MLARRFGEKTCVQFSITFRREVLGNILRVLGRGRSFVAFFKGFELFEGGVFRVNLLSLFLASTFDFLKGEGDVFVLFSWSSTCRGGWGW